MNKAIAKKIARLEVLADIMEVAERDLKYQEDSLHVVEDGEELASWMVQANEVTLIKIEAIKGLIKELEKMC